MSLAMSTAAKHAIRRAIMRKQIITATLVFFATSTFYLGFGTYHLAHGNLQWMPDPYAQMAAVQGGK